MPRSKQSSSPATLVADNGRVINKFTAVNNYNDKLKSTK
jgi:hypothetical protein